MTEKIRQLIETYVTHQNFIDNGEDIDKLRKETIEYFENRTEQDAEKVLLLWIENEDCSSGDPDENWDMDYDDEEE